MGKSVDNSFPYEFSIPFMDEAVKIELRIKGENMSGNTIELANWSLSRF